MCCFYFTIWTWCNPDIQNIRTCSRMSLMCVLSSMSPVVKFRCFRHSQSRRHARACSSYAALVVLHRKADLWKKKKKDWLLVFMSLSQHATAAPVYSTVSETCWFSVAVTHSTAFCQALHVTAVYDCDKEKVSSSVFSFHFCSLCDALFLLFKAVLY